METENTVPDKENCEYKTYSSYTFAEDMAIVHYMTTDNRFLLSSGISTWKEAEKLQICPGRSYLSMKERFRKVIVKNLKQYSVEKSLVIKITEFIRANQNGKHKIRDKLSCKEHKVRKELSKIT